MKSKIIKNSASIFAIAAMIVAAVSAVPVFASSTDGTIDSVYKYAWSENVGWINFKADSGNVSVVDSGLSGYAWSSNYGWINLSPPTSGVNNDGSGNLSGYAWGENIGWIDFSGVTIDSNGYFLGYAGSTVAGQISFNCFNTGSCASSDFKIRTDWRPRAERPVCNNAIDDDNDGKIDYPDDPGCNSLDDDDETDSGRGLPPSASNPPVSPAPSEDNLTGEFKIIINNNDEYTNNPTVSLKLIAGADTAKMAISDNPEFDGASQIAYEEIFNFQFPISPPEADQPWAGNEQILTIYAKFYTQYGQPSEVVSDSIILDTAIQEEEIEDTEDTETLDIEEEDKPAESDEPNWIDNSDDEVVDSETQDPSEPAEPDEPSIIEKITDDIIDIFKPDPEPEPEPEIKIEDLVAKETPASMQGEWNLFPQEQINEFVLAPLPKGLERLAQKFPELENTFKEVGISKITDLQKLRDFSLSLSGLAKSLGLEEKDLALVKDLPLSEFPQEIKNRIPTEIIFAQISGEKNIKSVDFDIKLSVNDQGEAQQKIRAISGKKLFLTIKPESKAKSVTGYLAFKGTELTLQGFKTVADSNEILKDKFRGKFQNLFNSFVFARPVFAQDYDNIEEKLITQKFAYADEDNDGIWTAKIQAPIVEGEYEVITLIEYEDPELGTRMVKLTTVVDPEGYVYERIKEQELRIMNSVVSIYQLNSESGEYELWQASNYQQKNPQTTDTTGRYSFLVPEGTYYITAEAPDYLSYQSEPFAVQEGAGVHQNIELKIKGGWLKALDWKVLAIFLLFILVVWNFWRDRKRI